jgi:hypothetical protein
MTFDHKPPSGGLFRFGIINPFEFFSNPVLRQTFGLNRFWPLRQNTRLSAMGGNVIALCYPFAFVLSCRPSLNTPYSPQFVAPGIIQSKKVDSGSTAFCIFLLFSTGSLVSILR